MAYYDPTHPSSIFKTIIFKANFISFIKPISPAPVRPFETNC